MDTQTLISSKKSVIYIPLLDEGVPVARPTLGERIKDNIFKVLPTENYDPDDETWMYPPGSVVQCELRELMQGVTSEKVLLAVKEFQDNE